MADRKRRGKKGVVENKEDEKLDKSSKAVLKWLRNIEIKGQEFKKEIGCPFANKNIPLRNERRINNTNVYQVLPHLKVLNQVSCFVQYIYF